MSSTERNDGHDSGQSLSNDRSGVDVTVALMEIVKRIRKAGKRGTGCTLSRHEVRLLQTYNLPSAAEDVGIMDS